MADGYFNDGTVNIADTIALLGYLFNSAPPPGAPFTTCGTDPTEDALDCEAFSPCE